uniref:MaoC-like domain-containing protein n=1 Tax=Aegilops tauschii subsp. strangulata TaxID=200361 RepID=A0A452ZRL4_AEGTS
MRLVSLARAAPRVRAASTAATPTLAAALKVGDALRPRRRRFTEEDVAAYAGVSGDRNPVHLDDAFARGTGGFQRGRVVHGMLVASLFPALIASHFPGAVYASQSLKFAAPVHVGDEVVAQVQALHIKATGARHINAISVGQRQVRHQVLHGRRGDSRHRRRGHGFSAHTAAQHRGNRV